MCKPSCNQHERKHTMKSTNTLLALIFIALIAVFGFMVYEENQDTPLENAAESISKSVEDISNQ